MSRRALDSIPLLLTALRAALGPVVVSPSMVAPSRLAFGACLVILFLSDVFDGIIARRLGIATPALRRLDSIADTVFYVCATFAVWQLFRSAITDRWLALTVLVALEGVRYVFDLVKFRREASYHMWSSKLWGIALFAGFFSLLAMGQDGVMADAAVYVGIVADFDGLAILVVMRTWQSDIPSLVHAFRLRNAGRN